MPNLPMFATPGSWMNQPVALYHGTLDHHVASVLAGVDPSKGQRKRDFGLGFYTTTVERQARSWAWQLARKNPGAHPAVIRFDVDRDALAGLEGLFFIRGGFDAEDYWSFVSHCRLGRVDHARPVGQGWYDMVCGPIAASWQQRLIIHDTDQVSFHTRKAAQVLDTCNPREVP